jgi:Ribulose 1,5-bisphosphate carboxylase, large subunit
MKPKLELSNKNYDHIIFEELTNELNFTKDDENINNQPFMHWHDHFLFCIKTMNKTQTNSGEIKKHYLNITTTTMENIYKHTEITKTLNSNIIMIDLVINWTTIQSINN